MSLKETIQPFQTAAKIVAAGLALAIPGIAGVTALHHREETHESLELHPVLKTLIRAEMRVYSPDSTIWAAVHRIHHSVPDATLAPFYRITRAIDWMQANPKQAQGVTIPDSYQYLDRFVDRFSREDVLTIGHYAEDLMIERLGGTYEPPSSYTEEELKVLLNPTEPMYFYPKGPKHAGEYTQDEIADILLGDPHSPVRIPPPQKNGVRGVLEDNVELYRIASHLFRDRPELKPKDLQTGKVVDHQKVRYIGFVEGSLVAAGLVLLYRNKYEPKDFLKALLAGTAINTVKLGFHIAGGNVTNSLGHAGKMTPERNRIAIFGKEYRPDLNPDGTVSTDSVNGGLLGRLISMFTFDEVGGQKEHHLGPDKIAFTSQEGIKAWMEAPWGMFLSVLARSRYFPFIKEGPGFEGDRPDKPSPGVELIHLRRAKQMEVSKHQGI